MRGIYEIRNIVNDKVYIGQSIHLEERIKRHKRELKKGIHYNKHLQRSYDKYGDENFVYTILYCADENEDLDKLEQQYIEQTHAFTNGYNRTLGGGGDLGMNVTHEFRMRMRDIVMGENNPNYGHHWTDDMKKALSIKMSQGQRKGSNNANAKSVIRVEDCHIFLTQEDAAHDMGLLSGTSISRCVKNPNAVAKGCHFVPYSQETYEYLQDEEHKFQYLCKCYRQAAQPYIACIEDKQFYTKQEFIKYINKTLHIPIRTLKESIKLTNTFVFNKKTYQLLVA